MRDAALWLKDRCRAAGVPFCVNDRLDVALAVGADAVHLGQDDLPLADARADRRRAGSLIGFSTHNPAQAAAAVAGGADYIGFGPIFDTRSKLRPDPTVGVEGLRAVAAASPIPVVAIGGITLDTVASVAARRRGRRGRDRRGQRRARPAPPRAATVAARVSVC